MSNAIANVSLFYTFFCQPTLQIASNLLNERHREQWSELQKVIAKQYVSAYWQDLALSLINLLPFSTPMVTFTKIKRYSAHSQNAENMIYHLI